MVTFTGDARALVSNPAHQHGLKLVATDKLFQCDGCKQLGDEERYRCERCDFDLHLCCALAPASTNHSMFQGRVLTFFHSRPATAACPPGIIPFCDVCGDQVCGFLYHNREHDLDLHPFCATLPKRMSIEDDDDHVLELHMATGHNCALCGKSGYRSQFLAYCCHDEYGELVYLHVACMVEAKYSSDDEVMQTSSTTTGEVSDRRLVNAPTKGELAMVQYAPRRRRGRFRRFCKVVYRVAMVSYSVATMNPVGVITAIAS